MMAFSVTIKQLEKSYLGGDGKKIPVLKGVNLEICSSETVAIIGESGCGKKYAPEHYFRDR